MSILVKNNIHWVGQRDWEVRDFTALNTKRCVAAAITAISFVKKRMC